MSSTATDSDFQPEPWVERLLELPKDFDVFTKHAIPDEYFERSIAYEACIAALLDKLAFMSAITQAPGIVLGEISMMSAERKMFMGRFASQLRANRENR